MSLQGRRYLLAAWSVLALTSCTRPPQGACHIQFAFWGSVQQEKLERQIVEKFEAAHPGIKVDLLAIGARYNEKLQAMMVGGVAPDVFMTDMRHYDEWASRGVLTDLTTEMQKIGGEADILPVPWKAFARDGKFFALPINCHGYVMYANLDAFREAGIDPLSLKTWDDVEQAIPRLSSRDGSPGAPTDYAVLMPDYQIILFWAYGAHLFDDPFHPKRVTINSPEAGEALAFLRKMHANPGVVPPSVMSEQGAYQLFRDGKVALYFSGRWIVPELAAKTRFAWDVFPLPAGPAGNKTLHGGTALAIWNKTLQPEAARAFVNFYASREGASLAMREGRNAPIFKDLAFGPEFLALHPPASMARYSETMLDGHSEFAAYTAGTDEISQIFTGRMEQALACPGLPGSQILSGLEEDLNRWLERSNRRGRP